MSNIAISYARFSSAGQAEGHSLVRQIERAAEYAAANDFVIDQQLSFRDLGVSGWDRSNIEKGALGLLLTAVNEGRVPIGATLIVESFDRLSRAEPIDALSIFQQIIGAGLNLVTLTEPPKRFNRQTLRANPFQLFEALLDMHRANAESDRKSDLLGKSWEKRRQNAIATKAVMTSKAPLWISAEGPPRNKHFHLIPERVEVVKRVLKLAKSGVGNHTIIKTLNLEGVPSWPRSAKEEAKRKEAGLVHTWEPSYIQKMLTHPALYGAVKVKGGDLIEGYYPPIIAYDEFVYLQSLRSVRATRKTTSRKGVGVTNLFSGLLRCGYCDSQMIVNGYTRTNGEQFKYVACHGARTGKTSCRMHAWSLRNVVPEFFRGAADLPKLLSHVPSGVDTHVTGQSGLGLGGGRGGGRVVGAGWLGDALDQ
jgi:DNA invertase Pin-like site-specific DNA recombinase